MQPVSAPATADTQAELVDAIAEFTHDPLGFVLFVFPWGEPGTPLARHPGPRRWQREVLESIGEKLRAGGELGAVVREAVASGHGIGKSALVAWIVLWALSTFEDARGVVTANTDTQLRTKTWPEVAKWHGLALVRPWFVLTATSLYASAPGHDKTWRFDAVPWSETNTEAFAGLHNEGKRLVLIFDEASAVADKVWEVAEGALTDADTEILWAVFGNPTRATGRFRECFRRFKHRWTGRHIDSRTVEGTSRAQLDAMVADYGEDSDIVKIRIRGLFPALSVKQFISEADVDAAFGRHLRPEQYQHAPKVLTCDPAWEGDDSLEIGLRQGLAWKHLLSLPKNDNDGDIAAILARLEDEHQADAVFIDKGYGTGIYSFGKTLRRNWLLVDFGSAAPIPGFRNMRAWIWAQMRDWLKAGGAIPADPGLRDELLAVETVATLDGTVQLESKRDMKARGVPSPNKADALAISFAYPVTRRGTNRPLTAAQTGTDYDPYG